MRIKGRIETQNIVTSLGVDRVNCFAVSLVCIFSYSIRQTTVFLFRPRTERKLYD